MACFEHLGGDNVQIGTSVAHSTTRTVFIYGPFRNRQCIRLVLHHELPHGPLEPGSENAETTMSVEKLAGEGFEPGPGVPEPPATGKRPRGLHPRCSSRSDLGGDEHDRSHCAPHGPRHVQPAGNSARSPRPREGLTAGMYTYTITVDGARATRKLSDQVIRSRSPETCERGPIRAPFFVVPCVDVPFEGVDATS